MRPYGLYPNRLLCLWDSPGKNTQVGCHALHQGIFLTHLLFHQQWMRYSIAPYLHQLLIWSFFVCFILATLIGVTYREAWNAVVHGGRKGLLSCVWFFVTPMDCSYSVHGIFQARVLEWVAIYFSRGSSQPKDWTPISLLVGRHRLSHQGSPNWMTNTTGMFSYVYLPSVYIWASLVAQTVKNLPLVQETQVRSLGWEDSLEKEVVIHSSILAWRIPWQRSLVGYSPWSCKESDTT